LKSRGKKKQTLSTKIKKNTLGKMKKLLFKIKIGKKIQ
jgi:hypothetical protein